MEAKNANVVKLDLNITKKRKTGKKINKLQVKRLQRKVKKSRHKASKYYKLLPNHVKSRLSKTKKVCKRVEVFDMADCGFQQNFEPTITDVAEWSNLHQIAYWKSRAISLEYENKMLYKHIRETHCREIGEYVKSKAGVEEIQNQFSKKANIGKKLYEKPEECEEEKKKYLPPKFSAREEESEKMIALYGSMAPKISGMEAAAQLNYNFQVENNVPYWPNIPLKL